MGVELGQIIFVLAILGVFRLLALKKDWPMFAKQIPAYAIGSVAAFWLIERIAGF